MHCIVILFDTFCWYLGFYHFRDRSEHVELDNQAIIISLYAIYQRRYYVLELDVNTSYLLICLPLQKLLKNILSQSYLFVSISEMLLAVSKIAIGIFYCLLLWWSYCSYPYLTSCYPYKTISICSKSLLLLIWVYDGLYTEKYYFIQVFYLSLVFTYFLLELMKLVKTLSSSLWKL